jgi:hypothetical protein
MRCNSVITLAAVAAALLTPACSGQAPPAEPAREAAAPTAAETAAAELRRKRDGDTAGLDKRVADLERRLTEMQGKIVEKSATPTAALRAEVQEDVKNAREAVADLKSTTPENWWERHERAMERAAADIEEDVRRLARGRAAPAATPDSDAAAGAAPFESRRDRFVTRLRSRVEAMEAQLKNVRARDAQKTEVQDTQARVEKLEEDLDNLRTASADDWWEISAERVGEYIDRVERSIGRLDDNTGSASR